MFDGFYIGGYLKDMLQGELFELIMMNNDDIDDFDVR
jgi:hypothetical protein